VHPQPTVNPWTFDGIGRHRGGRVIAARQYAPLGRTLPYRRAAGQYPPGTGGADTLRRLGWSVVLGERSLGDVLLALALVRALAEGTGIDDELRYRGSRPRLLQRCQLSLATDLHDGPHTVHGGGGNGRAFRAVPERPSTLLDVLDEEYVEVHAALPMRYYLTTEQHLGVRLPVDHAPVPTFMATEAARPFHVVFVSATSWASRKDYGVAGFARIAAALTQRHAAPWAFTIITSCDTDETPVGTADIEFQVLSGLDAVDCLDVFASAEMVIGNDTGLSHLAALTERPDGTGPQVIGLYGRHAHTKWTTGSDRHHAIATPFSQMLSAADRCPVRDHLDDSLWSASAALTEIPPELIAEFACHLADWW
jgi:Glycosyltransferase family 9 (heptosyltransferase)